METAADETKPAAASYATVESPAPEAVSAPSPVGAADQTQPPAPTQAWEEPWPSTQESAVVPAAEQATAEQATAGKVVDSGQGKEPSKPTEPPVKSVPLSKLWTYATSADLVLIFIACFFAMAQGAAMPAFAVVMGRSADIMNLQGDCEKPLTETMRPMLYGMLGIMGGTVVCGTIHNTLLGIT